MGSRASELEKEGKVVGFSFEEAIGFCLGDIVKDKVRSEYATYLTVFDYVFTKSKRESSQDGISAAAVLGEIVANLSQRGISLSEYMTELYDKYGHFVTNNK